MESNGLCWSLNLFSHRKTDQLPLTHRHHMAQGQLICHHDLLPGSKVCRWPSHTSQWRNSYKENAMKWLLSFKSPRTNNRTSSAKLSQIKMIAMRITIPSKHLHKSPIERSLTGFLDISVRRWIQTHSTPFVTPSWLRWKDVWMISVSFWCLVHHQQHWDGIKKDLNCITSLFVN